MCEYECWKASYLMNAFPDVPHLFRDMKELGTGKGYCVRAGGLRDVPKARNVCCS